MVVHEALHQVTHHLPLGFKQSALDVCHTGLFRQALPDILDELFQRFSHMLHPLGFDSGHTSLSTPHF